MSEDKRTEGQWSGNDYLSAAMEQHMSAADKAIYSMKLPKMEPKKK
jgi:hypothetical protein